MPYFEYQLPGQTPTRVDLSRRMTTIGASTDNHLVLPVEGVAAAHATLTHQAGSYRIQSTRRAHVLVVAGKKTRDRVLTHGDIVAIGGVELVFHAIEPAASVDPTTETSLQLSLDAQNRLIELSQHLLQGHPQGELLEALMDHVIALCRADKGFLLLAKSQGEHEVCVSRKAGKRPLPNPTRLFSDKIVRSVIASREPQIISDAQQDQRFSNSRSVTDLRVSGVMCVPLLIRGELIGLLYVGNDSVVNRFAPEQLKILQIFAAQAALLLRTAHTLHDLQSKQESLAQTLETMRFGSLIGACPPMIEVHRRLAKVATTPVPVWLHGESGTGKERIARELHQRSERSAHPFCVFNCAVIPANRLETALFGDGGDQQGVLAQAMGGTLYLAQIDHLAHAAQLALLKALEHGPDLRLVVSSVRTPTELLSERVILEKLFFRLSVVDVYLPPLRDRGDDVCLLARYLLRRQAKEYGRAGPMDFAPGTLQAIRRFGWPGNVRQLENHIKKAVVLADRATITAADLGLDLGVDPTGGTDAQGPRILPLARAKEQWQTDYINKALALNSGNRAQTARDLGVDPRTVFRHLERLEKQKRSVPS